MATYNKRGYKAPKPEQEKSENQISEDLNQSSETAEVFNTLDASAQKAGNWFKNNQKYVLGFVGAIALGAIGYLGYKNFVLEPREEEAANEMFQAQSYYEQALQGFASDSLYNLALNGGEGKLGFLQITSTYSGTKSASLAHYYAGTSFFKLGKYKEAIKHLEKFESDDLLLKAMSLGVIGDAFSELNQKNEALEYYSKAAGYKANDFTTPLFSYKAGLIALELSKKEEANKFFTDIKNNYKNSAQAREIDFYIGLSK